MAASPRYPESQTIIRSPALPLALAALALVAVSRTGHAQQMPAASWVRASMLGVPAVTMVDPIPGGGSETEFRVVHPLVMVDGGLWGGRARLNATANFEGWTLTGGELSLGAWGEGFVDRRHPHTYIHELMLSGLDLLGSRDGRGTLSLAVGKGFVPFGTDDPMNRPPLRFPVNHHLSQILERAVAIAGYRWGPVAVEGALFNGDEPERPGQWPRIGNRFGDSRAVRLSVMPLDGLEIQGSHAVVHSPEHRSGSGPDDFKWSASARWEGPVSGRPAYALIEWARTSEANDLFELHTALAEAAYRLGPHLIYYRFERTERPEEERLLDPFRTPRPHVDDNILGITRWTIHTAGYRVHFDAATWFAAEPFAELSLGRVRRVGAGIFDPESFYGSTSLTSLSVGARLTLWTGAGHRHRMGRYGVLADSPHSSHPMTMPEKNDP